MNGKREEQNKKEIKNNISIELNQQIDNLKLVETGGEKIIIN